MKHDFVIPILVLSLICMFMTGSLALVNSLTQPIIAQSALERTEATMFTIIPTASGFVRMDTAGFPPRVEEIYRTVNDRGHIFIVSTSGYGGVFRVIVGIDPQGHIISSSVLPSHSETPGLGTIAFDRAVDYEGKTYRLEGVEVVSGATITFMAYKQALEDAFSALALIGEHSP